MSIAQALQRLFPGTQNGREYEIIDRGQGARISVWSLPSPIPSDAEIAAASALAVTAAQARAEILAIEEASGFNRRQREYLIAHSGDRRLVDALTVDETLIAQKRRNI